MSFDEWWEKESVGLKKDGLWEYKDLYLLAYLAWHEALKEKNT